MHQYFCHLFTETLLSENILSILINSPFNLLGCVIFSESQQTTDLHFAYASPNYNKFDGASCQVPFPQDQTPEKPVC